MFVFEILFRQPGKNREINLDVQWTIFQANTKHSLSFDGNLLYFIDKIGPSAIKTYVKEP